MTTQCLLVCENGVMVAGVKAVLAEQTELEIHTISTNIEMKLAQTIETLHPDTVIVDEEVCITLPAQLWKLLTSLPDLQVIIFNQNDNVLHIRLNKMSRESHVRKLGKIIRNHKSHSKFS